ncbi:MULTISPECIES: MFS transporter [Methanobrevibacter]|uniref:MFS transporter n=1 Tax=Methanobrevibacter TaxID=2172 RepID=UPI0003348602|nr:MULTISPECIES: MFS transporter [Methanobrevibacter]AGN16481.1 MFS transporter [Methanobrevibacter sp. AbM4]MCI6774301.1 MFS transporter [Methanobrevibacter boviskoreani]MCI6930152.1 MFS transporter [Methanobrevibacter boviskoreani]MDD6257188.1 MFS transporter [Methanobrevibacter boviskoreani]MDY5614810.1 MFS transporter [Methanobrevibacter boviskoreani]
MERNEEYNPNLLILIMTIGTFGILSTELGVIGILPQIAQYFNIGINYAGLFVSSFSITIAISSLFIPLIFSKYDIKKVFSLVLSIFVICSFVSALYKNFYIAILCRIIPALFYPAYISLSLTVAAEIVPEEKATESVSRVMMGVSAGSIIGVPITTFMATVLGFKSAMLWFAVVNLIALIATLIFFPNLPGNPTSYGTQISNAKTRLFLVSCLGVFVLLTGICTSYSYMSQFLQTITHIIDLNLSITLFLFGIASLFGNWAAGKLLVSKPNQTVITYPFITAILFILLFYYCNKVIPTVLLMIVWGFLDGLVNNIIQYWIVSAAPDAPEFANGIFISVLNIAITIGTSIGGFIIVSYGTVYIFIGSLVISLLSLIFLALRVRINPDYTK